MYELGGLAGGGGGESACRGGGDAEICFEPARFCSFGFRALGLQQSSLFEAWALR